jgi:glutamate:GABA antiporter
LTRADNTVLSPIAHQSQTHGDQLRRELGVADLALAQILIVIVPEFYGTAVKAGPAHVVLWLLAITLFFIPFGMLVAHLSRLMPLEGGPYEWARLAFSDRFGFLVAWNIWLLTTVQVSQIALITTTYISYAFGPRLEWIASNTAVLIAASIALIAGMMIVARVGLSVGKWVSNVGGVVTILILVVLILLPYLHLWRGMLPTYRPLALVRPTVTLFSLSVFSKMTFGALSGFEYVAIFAGESRNPARNLARSVLLSAPLIALLYIFGTSAILAFVSPDAVDVIGPVPQALARGLGIFGAAGSFTSVVILLLLMNYLCSYTLYFSANSRLPLVAGWDHLLPRWFTPLHPKYRTPVNSILFMGGVSLAASVAVLIGVSNQESFALLQTWAWTFYGLAYLGLFAIPLFSAKAKGLRPGKLLQLGAVSGFLVTLLFVVLSVVPIVAVASVWKYSVKIVLVVAGANLLGWLIYAAGQRKTARVSA